MIHFAAIPFSGASVNPARSLGPALVGSGVDSFWIYIVGPRAGAIIGWIVYAVVVKGDTNLRDDLSGEDRATCRAPQHRVGDHRRRAPPAAST